MIEVLERRVTASGVSISAQSDADFDAYMRPYAASFFGDSHVAEAFASAETELERSINRPLKDTVTYTYVFAPGRGTAYVDAYNVTSTHDGWYQGISYLYNPEVDEREKWELTGIVSSLNAEDQKTLQFVQKTLAASLLREDSDKKLNAIMLRLSSMLSKYRVAVL